MYSYDKRAHALRALLHSPYLLPGALLGTGILAMLIHGPIAQIPDYHRFADNQIWMGIPNASNVLSNLGFAVVGACGLFFMWAHRSKIKTWPGASGYLLFFTALLLTAFGSAWYHLAPDNARLVYDRLPIALACSGLLAAVAHDTMGKTRWLVPVMAAIAFASVAWWRYTDLLGAGDLRPYLLLQILPLTMIPLLQWLWKRPRNERAAFAAAIALYVAAKICEMADHALFGALAMISGHALKHLLAGLAAAILAWHLQLRLRQGA